jgi:small-conductance mechanosensitive channel
MRNLKILCHAAPALEYTAEKNQRIAPMSTQILWSLLTALGTYFLMRLIKSLLGKVAQRKSVEHSRVFYIGKVFDTLVIMTAVVIIAFIWSVDIKGISVVASSLFAVIGVALFAQWSILSNVTASIIIFFTFPARVGDTIKVIDGDNTVTGTIEKITLFQIELRDAEGGTVFYPNNLLLQKPVVKLDPSAASKQPSEQPIT